MNILIRPATIQDAPALAEIFNYAVLNTMAAWMEEPVTVQDRIEWVQSQNEVDSPIFVAVEVDAGAEGQAGDHGRVLGYASYKQWRPRPGYLFTVEDSVYIHPDFHGQGLGRKLLEKLIDHATAVGKHTMICAVEASNTASRKLHEGFGFQYVGTFRESGYKFDQWLDLQFFQLMLDDQN